MPITTVIKRVSNRTLVYLATRTKVLVWVYCLEFRLVDQSFLQRLLPFYTSP